MPSATPIADAIRPIASSSFRWPRLSALVVISSLPINSSDPWTGQLTQDQGRTVPIALPGGARLRGQALVVVQHGRAAVAAGAEIRGRDAETTPERLGELGRLAIPDP